MAWTCNVCACSISTVFTLPCQHHFCEKCLSIWVGVYTDTYRPGHQEFPCRVCWQIHYTPKGGLTAYRQEADICQLGLGIGSLTMETEDENTTAFTSNTGYSPDGTTPVQHQDFPKRTHYMPQVPHQSTPTTAWTSPLDNRQPQINTSQNNSEAMDETVMPTDDSDTSSAGVLSSSQLDTVNRNFDGKSGHPCAQLLPVMCDEYVTSSSRTRLCYPTCHMYHMV